MVLVRGGLVAFACQTKVYAVSNPLLNYLQITQRELITTARSDLGIRMCGNSSAARSASETISALTVQILLMIASDAGQETIHTERRRH